MVKVFISKINKEWGDIISPKHTLSLESIIA